jgi:hypothetical protein
MLVLPQRSPIPSAQPWTWSTPASTAASVDEAEPPFVVAVPVELDVRPARRRHERPHVADERVDAARLDVADRVADAQPAGAVVDRGPVEPVDRRRRGPRRVLGDVHHLEAFLDGEVDRLRGVLEHALDRPVLGVAADLGRADEQGRHDRHARLLHDARDRLDVVQVRARGAVRLDAQLAVADRLGQPRHVGHGPRPGAGQADVRRVDVERVHHRQDLDLLLDGRVEDRRRLQAVAQRLVVERHLAAGRPRVDLVPVVDQPLAVLLVLRGHVRLLHARR